MIAATSRAAYDSLRASGQLTEGQRRVMLVFHRYPQETFTRAEAAQRAQIPLQTCCGRVRELLDAEYLEELPARPCTVTGNPSHPLRVAPPKTAAASPEPCVQKPQASSSGQAALAAAHPFPTMTLWGGEVVEVVSERKASLVPGSGKFDFVEVIVRPVRRAG